LPEQTYISQYVIVCTLVKVFRTEQTLPVT
jgi:hypothetical protein